MKNKYYKYYQPNKNDPGCKYGDCVIRAFAKALGMDWLQVFDELVWVARGYQCMPNNKTCFEEYLKGKGFTYQGISNKKGTKRPTVESFAREHKDGTYVLIVANHVVAVVDGIYYDTFDCGHKCLYGFWKKNNSTI